MPACLRSNGEFSRRETGGNRANRPLPSVSSAEGIPANCQHIQKHSKAIAKHVHFRRGVVSPADWDLDYTQSFPLCDKQNLRIEPEALRALPIKYDAGLLTAKCLETALCILEGETCGPTHNVVEEDAGLFPQRWLMDLD